MRTDFISWIHFGDLHMRNIYEENHIDFLELINEVNEHAAGEIDFVFLPGDNADDGTEEQYRLVRQGLDRLTVAVEAITGDHDIKNGSLELFRRYLEPKLYRCVYKKGFQLLFLNATDGATAKEFDFSGEQVEWLAEKLAEGRAAKVRPLVFTHLYPSELRTQGEAFGALLREFGVELVEMGHTHYNELANDGRTIYATTRSTGQTEEGPPGISFTTIDGDVVSWKFKERGVWPLVSITTPCERRLITRPESEQQVVRGSLPVRAKVWGAHEPEVVTCSIDDGAPQLMTKQDALWEWMWDASETSDGVHRIVVEASGSGASETDAIEVLVNQSGHYQAPTRSTTDYENTIGAYPAKGIFGTELGPNEKGTTGPWPSWRS